MGVGSRAGSGWTTSYRWEPHKRRDLGATAKHDVRNVEEQAGIKAGHENYLIRGWLTGSNVSLLNDGQGGFRRLESLSEVGEYLDARLEQVPNFYTKKDGTRVTRKRREDATVFTEVVLELDPMFMREEGLSEEQYVNMTEAEFHARPAFLEHASPDRVEEVKCLLEVMVDEVVEDYGQENVVAVFWHWDETNPHVQLIGVPVAEDGSLSYSSKFGVKGNKTASRKKYSERHDRMRTRLRKAGDDATFERVSTGKARDLRTFNRDRKRERDLRERERQVEALSRETADFTHGAMAFADELNEREAQVEAARKAVAQETEKARKHGYAEGMKQGKAEGTERGKQEIAEEVEQARLARKEAEDERKAARAEGHAQGLAEGRQSVDEHVARLQAEWTRLRGLEGDLDDAIRDAKATKAPTLDQIRESMKQTVRDDSPNLIYSFLRGRDMKLKEAGKEPGWVKSFERFAYSRLGKDWREKWTQETQTHENALAEANKTRERVRREVEQAVRGTEREDDSLGF